MIPTFQLERFATTSHGTLGYLKLPNATLMTLEEEAQDNKPNISRIPAGRYLCQRRRYNKGGYDTWEVTNVPGRSLILFHRGNTEEDTQGCILVGVHLGVLHVNDEDGAGRVPKLAVTDSRGAFTILTVKTAKLDGFYLEISDPKA